MKNNVNLLNITLVGIFFLITSYSSYGQLNCSLDTIAMINDIRASYQEINKQSNNYKVVNEGTIDFSLYGEDLKNYATGDDSWNAKEIIKYFDKENQTIYKENTRYGAFQVGETRVFKEFYIKNGKLFFYYEREFFYSFVTSAFQSFVKEYRIYFCNENPIRLLKKELIWEGHPEEMNYDIFFDYATNHINKEKNQTVNINSYKNLDEIKTHWK